MQTLDIECPSCGEMLELDAGFAGGVCRCSNCGTLMTVPSDAGKAESLTRPTSSVSMGSGGISSMGVPDPGPSRSTRTSKSSRSKGKKGKKGKSSRSKRISTKVEVGEYRTASGKVIRVDETTRVPMADSKKKQIRVATTVVFFGIVAAVVAVAVIGIIAIMGGPGGGSAEAVYDPAKNPYTLEFANVMGLPVTGRTVIVIEASEYSSEWTAQAGDMIASGLGHESKDAEVELVSAEPTKAVLFAGGMPSGLPIPAGSVTQWFERLPDTGEADIEAAIKKALDLEPSTLIVVVGYADTSSIEAWDALVASKEDLTVHAVHMGNSSPELQGWMGERGGELVVLSGSDIDALKDMAGDESSEAE